MLVGGSHIRRMKKNFPDSTLNRAKVILAILDISFLSDYLN